MEQNRKYNRIQLRKYIQNPDSFNIFDIVYVM